MDEDGDRIARRAVGPAGSICDRGQWDCDGGDPEIAVAIAAAAYLGRIFGLKEKLASLLGIGIGVCGVSAIISSTSAIEAEEEDAAYAIAIILLFGAIMLFLYPALGTLLGMSDLAFGYWTGLSIDNTAGSGGHRFRLFGSGGEHRDGGQTLPQCAYGCGRPPDGALLRPKRD